MTWKRVVAVAAAILFCLLLGANQASAQCKIALNQAGGPFDLNAEGLTERSTDVVISSLLPGQSCFTTGNNIGVQWNALMTVPAVTTPPGVTGTGVMNTTLPYYEIHDASGTLGVLINTTTVSEASGAVTQIEIDVETGTNNAAATVVLKNLRFDLTGTVPYVIPTQSVPDGTPLFATLSTTQPINTQPVLVVGNSKRTVAARKHAVDILGFGYEDGVCPFGPFICGHPNKGGEINMLVLQSTWSFSTNPAWITDFSFRRVGETFTPVTGDPNNIGPTDLVLDVESIPAGVTVTFPNELIACGEGPLAIWQTSGTPSTTGGSLAATYKTIFRAPGVLSVTLTVDTAGAADNGCDAVSFDPLIGVVINDPSGTGTATLRVVMGPAPAAQFAGDDAQPNAVPRYLNRIANAAPTREIIGNTTNGGPIPYFVVNPTRTILLYPYVTNLMGWETGIEMGNTGNDDAVFGNTGQSGALDVHFFPTGGAPFAYTLKAGNGRGLDAAGLLEAGGDFADTLSDLLKLAGHPGSFEGYLIIVGHFNFGHGSAAVFNANGSVYGVPALVLGGSCSFVANNNFFNSFPTCSSAREGDVTRLPERLDQ